MRKIIFLSLLILLTNYTLVISSENDLPKSNQVGTSNNDAGINGDKIKIGLKIMADLVKTDEASRAWYPVSIDDLETLLIKVISFLIIIS